jgi:peptide/nickel transport system substrate-binding protein
VTHGAGRASRPAGPSWPALTMRRVPTRRRRARRVAPLLAASASALALAACGGSGGGDAPSGRAGAPAQGRQGGTLTVLWADDVDAIDPGQTYTSAGFMVAAATQRTPMNFKPEDPIHPIPDLASAPPRISGDGRTVTLELRSGVRFSPHVNRAVTSRDVKYAVERGFFSTVNNGYAGAYFGDIRGAKVGAKPGTEIPGIETPDDRTVVFHLTRGTGGVLAGALALPLAAPVPADYARRFDARNPSAYGEHQVATGPYMVEGDASGRSVGYQPGRRIHLVRNPGWRRATDFKPAHLDEIDMQEGNDDVSVAARRILTGSHLVNGDFSPPPAVLRQASRTSRDQLALVPSGGTRYVVMNTTIAPFDDVDVRRAVVAGFDRRAMLLTRGGAFVGDTPTHFLPPNIPGFTEAGGMRGPAFDFLSHPGGDMALAARYFAKAGYASGRYDGGQDLLMIGVADGVPRQAAEVAKANFEKLGFHVRLRLVTADAMYTKFCNVPKAEVAICPNAAWFKDFADPQTLLDPTFNGHNILTSSNWNQAQLDVPAINRAMTRAETLVGVERRARAWAAIDRQVTAQAPAVPWIWDRTPLIRSPDVAGVASKINNTWDLTYTALR